MLFAITDNGILTALDHNGVPQLIFDQNGDGVADSVDIQIGGTRELHNPRNGAVIASSFPALNFGVTGLAFSPFDFNLWHPTTSGKTIRA